MKRVARIGILAAVYAALLVGAFQFMEFHDAPGHVQAQNFEPFSRTFNLPASASIQYIPACTTGTSGCIPNFKQVAHEVTVTLASSSVCSLLLDGSNDNTHFVSITATSQATGAPTNFATIANGYFLYLRLKVLPCAVSQTINYVGFSSPIPIAASMNNFVSDGITSIAGTLFTGTAPFVVGGFQCSNPGGSIAFLQLYINPTTPTTGEFYEIGIPAGQEFSYTGPPILSTAVGASAGTNTLYAGAMTTAGGTTPVGTGINCNFQINSSGPYFPFFPASP